MRWRPPAFGFGPGIAVILWCSVVRPDSLAPPSSLGGERAGLLHQRPKQTLEVRLEPAPQEVRPVPAAKTDRGATIMVGTRVATYSFNANPIEGTTSTVGLSLGWGNSVAVGIAKETANGAMAYSLHVGRSLGVSILRRSLFIAVLFPTGYVSRLRSDAFSAVVLSGSLAGLRACWCGPSYPWAPYMDIRLPRYDLWLFSRAAGEGLGSNLGAPGGLLPTSWGIEIEVGVLRF